MTGPIIEAANVSKIFGSGPARVQALNDVNLTLNGGKLTVLMGPSGGSTGSVSGATEPAGLYTQAGRTDGSVRSSKRSTACIRPTLPSEITSEIGRP
jgi:ABC-type branched-subunit amino acid transport system ATPase component